MSSDLQCDLDTIVESGRLGNEPSHSYLDCLSALDNVTRECMLISRMHAGIAAPSSKHFYASALFTALITRAVTLLIFAPHSSWADKRIEHWDYASVTGVVRTMLELRLSFYYLCIEACPETEWQCRWNIFNLHDCVSRRKLLEARGGDPDEVTKFEHQEKQLHERLIGNAHFSALPSKQQKRFLHGHSAFITSLEEIAEKISIDRSEFRWLYILFSNHVHGLPMSFYRIASGKEERGRGLPSPIEEGYTSLCLSLAVKLLVGARDEYLTLFQGVIQPIEPSSSATPEPLDDEGFEADRFPVGSTKDLELTDLLMIQIVRTSPDELEFTYRTRDTNETVLKRSMSEEGSALHWFDPVFWSVIVNGQPTTSNMLDAVQTQRRAFKIDCENRTIKFKTEV